MIKVWLNLKSNENLPINKAPFVLCAEFLGRISRRREPKGFLLSTARQINFDLKQWSRSGTIRQAYSADKSAGLVIQSGRPRVHLLSVIRGKVPTYSSRSVPPCLGNWRKISRSSLQQISDCLKQSPSSSLSSITGVYERQALLQSKQAEMEQASEMGELV